jgi:hypothetical protein
VLTHCRPFPCRVPAPCRVRPGIQEPRTPPDQGGNSSYKFQQSPCIRWFGHLGNTLKELELDPVAVNPRIIAEFPRLEYLLTRCARVPAVDDPDLGGNILESDLRDAFRGSLEFDIYSRDSGAVVFAAFADYPLSYDAIRIDVRAIDRGELLAEVINRLISRCSDTLGVLDIRLMNERTCKSGPAQL